MNASVVTLRPRVTESALHIEGEGLLEKVMAYQNPKLVARLENKLGLGPAEANALFHDVKQFLYLCGTVSGQWGPSPKIDDGWHEFILYTKDYSEFCEAHFGRYLHHRPNDPKELADHRRPRRTLEAAKTIFGVDNLSDNWVYPNFAGQPTLGPHLLLDDALNPCDSCGCSPCSD